ncbi:hypothetical protein, partial [Thiolapillus sp.]|uniref:hypothetical protein n=1 Tax=Thiolapillus sp. TaxID=2017437 RepID=UPI003AF6657E
MSIEKFDHDGNTIILTLPALLLWNSKEDNIVLSVDYLLSLCFLLHFFQSALQPFCSALHVLYILFFLLQLLCQFTYLTRHGGDSGPERLQVCREIVE